ncbi:MAG TPA: ankyrin repeat domain-containing protein [Steroidobacteraceae bacterium]|nr:ankyrin repeat domain-containing protein [Steroidobacteraceae bacterium]
MKSLIRHSLIIATLCGAPAHHAMAAAPRTATSDPLEPARAALRTLQFQQALALLDIAQRSGNAEAEYLLGLMYLNGVGTAADAARGRQLIRTAAEQGHGAAQFVWAGELMRGAAPDPMESRRWLARSAQRGYTRAADALKNNRPLLAREAAGEIEPGLFSAWVIGSARSGNVEELRKAGPKAASVRDEFGRSALAYAVASGSAASAAILLEFGADTGAADAAGTSPLMLAAQRGDAPMLTMLLTHGADVQTRDAEQRSALFYAARANRVAALDLLQGAGAALEARDARGYNALDAALVVGAEEAAARLRALGLRPNQVAADSVRPTERFDGAHPGELYRGWPALAVAVARDDTASVKKSLEAGADVNQHSPQGDSLLKVAGDSHALQVIPLLVARHADASRADNSGHGVLWVFATRNDARALKALLEAGVGADMHTAIETTPLIAAVRGGHMDAVSLLLGTGADPNAADAQGHSPLMLASASGAAAMIQLLLEHRADVDAQDHDQRSALHYAASANSRAGVEALLAAGAGPKVLDAHGATPLHVAASRANADLVAAFMATGMDINRQDERGDTPLILAAAAGHAETLKMLLSGKPALDTQNKTGDTALIVASRGGHQNICQILLSAGANRLLRNGSGISAGGEATARGFPALAADLGAR